MKNIKEQNLNINLNINMNYVQVPVKKDIIVEFKPTLKDISLNFNNNTNSITNTSTNIITITNNQIIQPLNKINR